jgi:alkanesulfonate monooxygenase SsuD/methylene tetrahydromethanopterin reductase-like flavin-dependent oxidoreductase (luciferase family)
LRLSAAVTTVCGAEDGEVGRRAAAVGQDVAQLKAGGLCGTPAEVVDRLGQWSDAGAATVYLQLLDLTDTDHVRLLGEEVLRHLQ